MTGGPDGDGLAWLSATGDAVTVADILDAVDQRAEQLRRLVPDVPAGRARFAALGDLVLRDGFTLFDHALGIERADGRQLDPSGSRDANRGTAAVSSGTAAANRRRRRDVVVTIDLATLLALRDDPAELAGFGPIPARLARLVAADATLRRMVTDPVTGEALDLGRRTYPPTGSLATAIRARDRSCRFPGCARARRTEIDHRHDWALGGETNAANLHLLCPRHHALKTAGLWSVHTQADGGVVWTGPDGQRAIRWPEHPPEHPPDLADTG